MKRVLMAIAAGVFTFGTVYGLAASLNLTTESLGAADTAVATALRFTLRVPGVHTAIVGTTKPARWQQNAALLRAGALPRDDFERIRARWREVADTSWVGQV